MDEKFHGYNPAEGSEPTLEVLRPDTLMHSPHASHASTHKAISPRRRPMNADANTHRKEAESG